MYQPRYPPTDFDIYTTFSIKTNPGFKYLTISIEHNHLLVFNIHEVFSFSLNRLNSLIPYHGKPSQVTLIIPGTQILSEYFSCNPTYQKILFAFNTCLNYLWVPRVLYWTLNFRLTSPILSSFLVANPINLTDFKFSRWHSLTSYPSFELLIGDREYSFSVPYFLA